MAQSPGQERIGVENLEARMVRMIMDMGAEIRMVHAALAKCEAENQELKHKSGPADKNVTPSPAKE